MDGEAVLHRHGIDVLEIARMETALNRSGPGFLARAFTPAEVAECGGVAARLAGRWAAKEAVIKCFAATPICCPSRGSGHRRPPKRCGCRSGRPTATRARSGPWSSWPAAVV